MVTGADLNSPGVGVRRINVVVMDESAAGAGVGAEELPDDAVVTREVPPRLTVVNRAVFHAASLPGMVPCGPDITLPPPATFVWRA